MTASTPRKPGRAAIVAETYKKIVDGVSEQAKATLDLAIAAGGVVPVRSWGTSCALTWMIERMCHQMVHYSSPESDDAIVEAFDRDHLADLVS